MAACGYGISLLVFNLISHEWVQRTREISSWTWEEIEDITCPLVDMVLNSISHEWAQRTSAISSWTREDKIHIHKQAYTWKNLLDSDCLRAVQFKCVTVVKKLWHQCKLHIVILVYDWQKDNEKFCRPRWYHVKQCQKFCTETLKKVFSNAKKMASRNVFRHFFEFFKKLKLRSPNWLMQFQPFVKLTHAN